MRRATRLAHRDVNGKRRIIAEAAPAWLGLRLGDYGEQGPTGNEDEDERAYGPECGAHFMGLRSEIGRKVQQPRHNISIEKDASEQERWPGRDEKKAGDQEEWQVLQVIQLNAP